MWFCSEIAEEQNISDVNLELNIHFNERISYFQVITHPDAESFLRNLQLWNSLKGSLWLCNSP